MNVGIIGAGAWGSALGAIIARGGNDVCLVEVLHLINLYNLKK